MGILNSKKTCAICNKELGLRNYSISAKKSICLDCLEKSHLSSSEVKTLTSMDICEAIKMRDEYALRYETFRATRKVGKILEFDDNKNHWLLSSETGNIFKNKIPRVYNFIDIEYYQLIENDTILQHGGFNDEFQEIAMTTSPELKETSICNNLKIKIAVKDRFNPVIYIDFIKNETMKNDLNYKRNLKDANDCMAALKLTCDSIKASKEPITSNADEILKYKNLLDMGIISEEEFEHKKTQLLNL